ncbi:hypothetical protein P1P75_02295 [Streptomyces sp. ID05-39B]|uniref:hypothetical protein n=1 Tax=Streptomyces sp. ID05-39B TaxID=3028664 RepID=UPI0029B5E0B8|nr:hypothetical protein [Streptomyces sp. ID05-39B]MDX3525293.1 hypothetical protein [Streptomyces sp. ID05-39B]
MRLTMHHASPRRGAERLRRPVRRSTLLLGMAALPVALVVPLATPAEAAPVSVTFTPGVNQPFTVPSGVTQLVITATGAAGQNGTEGGVGGDGSTVTGTVNVPSGTTTLYVNVDTGGGSSGGSFEEGGAGGGASDVRTCDSTDAGCFLTGNTATDPRLIVAGGGGGGGAGFDPYPAPEATGGDAGVTGQTGGSRPNGGGGGGGGTQTTPGAGGTACPDTGGPVPSTPGTPGGGGTGGNGGGPFSGGGGGAGWFGGGGGGGCDLIDAGTYGPGGGGGGSDRVPAGGTSGPATGPASVTITYEQANGNNGGGNGSGSILPINLSGILPMFNNISVNNNIKSPGAGNTTTQNLGLNRLP